MSDERLDATVRGRVQGVGFRYFVIHHAMRLELTGWDVVLSVRCIAEGPRTALQELLEILERGPAGALVERVITSWGPASERFTSFEVRSGGHPGD